MKIKVFSLKSLSKYFSKIIVIFAIVIVLGRFLYTQKTANICLKVNSTKFMNLISKEVSLFKGSSNSEKNSYLEYSKKVVESEFELAKLATIRNISDLNINSEIENIVTLSENKEDNNSENTMQTISEEIVEPEVR